MYDKNFKIFCGLSITICEFLLALNFESLRIRIVPLLKATMIYSSEPVLVRKLELDRIRNKEKFKVT